MKLFFIAAVSQDDADYNLDLFAWAEDLNEAIILWRAYYEIESHTKPDSVFIVPCDRPDGQGRGVLRWGADLKNIMLEAVES